MCMSYCGTVFYLKFLMTITIFSAIFCPIYNLLFCEVNKLNYFTSRDLVIKAVYYNLNNSHKLIGVILQIYLVQLFSALKEPNMTTAWVSPQRSPEWDLHFFPGSGMCPSSTCGKRKSLLTSAQKCKKSAKNLCFSSGSHLHICG